MNLMTAGSGLSKTLLDSDAFRDQQGRTEFAPGLRSLKADAWTQFLEARNPSRKDENWRFATVAKADVTGFHSEGAVDAYDDAILTEQSDAITEYAGRIVFGDDNTVGSIQLDPKLAEQGVIWTSLQEAAELHPDLLEKYFMKEWSGLGSAKFAALHTAMTMNGIFLYVPDNVEVSAPFVAYHWGCTPDMALFPHSIVVTGANAKVDIVEIGQSKGDVDNLVVGCGNIFAGPGASVSHAMLQNFSLGSRAFQLWTSNADKDAHVRTVSINLGCDYLRHEHQTRIVGAGSNVETYSLSVPTGEQEFDQRTLQTHIAPHAKSDLLFKNALFDTSRTIFSGLIKVEENAQQTDAYQTNRNLILDPRADSNALPGLEIEANDVKCSHGATSSPLEESEMFYFLARGISRRKAREMLVFGFFEEIIGKLDNTDLADTIRGMISQKLAANPEG